MLAQYVSRLQCQLCCHERHDMNMWTFEHVDTQILVLVSLRIPVHHLDVFFRDWVSCWSLGNMNLPMGLVTVHIILRRAVKTSQIMLDFYFCFHSLAKVTSYFCLFPHSSNPFSFSFLWLRARAWPFLFIPLWWKKHLFIILFCLTNKS